jgi:hypothetical protein
MLTDLLLWLGASAVAAVVAVALGRLTDRGHPR